MAESTHRLSSVWEERSAFRNLSWPPIQSENLSDCGKQWRQASNACDPQFESAACSSSTNQLQLMALPQWRLKSLACDVLLTCREGSSAAERAVRSILDQQDIQVILHLVDDGGAAAAFVDRFRNRPNVLLHHNRKELGPWRTLQTLVQNLKTTYVAVQDPNCESRRDRMRIAVEALEAYGGEIFASAVSTPTGLIRPARPQSRHHRSIPSEGLVFRKASLVDLGGFADCAFSADADLMFRASCDERRIIARTEPLVQRFECPGSESIALTPIFPPPQQALSGVGFAQHLVACDVVLPFHGQLEFVRQAIESILEQEGTDVLLHLIDDGSPENTDDFLRYWQSHARVRTYRNSANIGQYTSFNNVIQFCETGLIAVQDGDDVSHPRRLFRAGNHLRLSQADIFGGGLVEFEGSPVLAPSHRTDDLKSTLGDIDQSDTTARLRSQYPVWQGAIEHFLFNGSAVMRRDAFKQLGGFTDYGTSKRNRCNLDTEFYARAFFAGQTFAVTQEIVSWCRRHTASATRNSITGWGTELRTKNVEETRSRVARWRQVPCHANEYGALGRYQSMTQPWPDSRVTFGQFPQAIAQSRADGR